MELLQGLWSVCWIISAGCGIFLLLMLAPIGILWIFFGRGKGDPVAEFRDKLNEAGKKIKMLQGQLKDEKKPPYAVRQALSLFLGTSLESTLTQPGIQAAQMTFVQQNAQKQAAAKMSGLSKVAKAAMTPEQGAQERLNKN